MILKSNEIRSYFSNAGFKGSSLTNAINICYCESGFDTRAHNTAGEDSRGLMQINIDVWKEFKDLDLYDPQTNANIAFEIYKRANNSFKDWSCAKLLNLTDPPQNNLLPALVFISGFLYYINSRM